MADLQAAVAGVWPWSTAVAGVALLLALVAIGVAARWKTRRDESAEVLPLLAEQTVVLPRLGGRHRRRRRQPTALARRRPVARPRPRSEERDTVQIRIYDPPRRAREGGRR